MTRTTTPRSKTPGNSPRCTTSCRNENESKVGFALSTRVLWQLFWVFILFVSTAPRSLSYAEAPPTSGEIEIEEMDQKRRPAAAINQQEATQFIASVQTFTQEGGKGALAAISDGAAQHLSVLYLYCLDKLGPCPFLLDTVLEADVAAARASGGNDCPSMSRFWKKWLDNDLERRARYLLPLGTMKAVASFNTVERPKYVKCNDTVNALKATADRYGAQGTATRAAAKTARLLSDIQDRGIDIYGAVGLRAQWSDKSGNPPRRK